MRCLLTRVREVVCKGERDAGIDRCLALAIERGNVDGRNHKPRHCVAVIVDRGHLCEVDVLIVAGIDRLPANEWSASGAQDVHCVRNVIARNRTS